MTESSKPIDTQAIPKDQVRDAAQAWGGTIAGIFTLGGIVTIIQGDTKAQQLTKGWQQLLVVLLIAALVLAVGAVIVAFGVAWEKETSESYKPLNNSIIATVVALVCLVGGAFVLWKGDQAAENSQQYLVTYGSSRTVACGTLTRDKDGNLVFSGGPLADVVEIVESNGCPKSS